MEATTAGVGPARLTGLATWLLGQTAAHAGRLVSEGFAAVGARGYHFRLLATLDEFGPASQSVLARRSGIHPTEIVGILDYLASRKFVERTPDSADRRRNIITLTDAGRHHLDALDAQINKVQEDLLAPLNPADRAELRRLLGVLLDHHNKSVGTA